LANVQQSVADFARAAQAIAQAQAAQSAARATALATPGAVPDGLTAGGLQVDPRALSNPSSYWTGATLPTASTQSGRNNVTVVQTSPQAQLNWQTFNVGANTTLNFDQGGSSWVALNRINDPQAAPSQILGSITAPGQVLVINRNGIVFGAGLQVNVNALVASTADVAASQFSGIYSTGFAPSFTGAVGTITVAAGAQIATNTPAVATDRGGFVLLLGSTVRNDGAIVTPNGQTVLAGGRDFIIRQGYSADSNPTSSTLGNEVAVVSGGAAINTGLIQATTGDITLTGQSVQQSGAIYATSSVGQRGTVHLITDIGDPASSVTLASGSLTYIQPDAGGATAINAQRSALLISRGTPTSTLNNQATLPDLLAEPRVEITAGGTVGFQSGSLTMATGGQIAISTGRRIFAATGALLDAAGSLEAVLPATATTLQIGMQGFELRDAPANRDTGALSSQTVNVAIGSLVAGSGAYSGNLYTAGGLLEVSGELGNVGHTIQEWTAIGGSITLAGNEVVAQPGAVFNIAGGTVRYQSGTVPTSWLVGRDGRLYNINTAPADVTYGGVYGGFAESHPRWGITETFKSPLIAPATIYQAGYTVGRDGGTLTISAPTSVFEATIDAGVVVGEQQNAARRAGVADAFLQPATAVPQAASLVFANANLTSETPFTTDLQVSQSVAPIASMLDVTTPLPATRGNTTWLNASLLNGAGLGGFSVTTDGTIRIDAPLTLADGGSVSLAAPNTEISAAITARAGSVTIGNKSNSASTGGFLESPSGVSVILNPTASIDTRGVFTNLAVDPSATAGEAFVNGGPVRIDSSQVVALAAGSVIDTSSGGAVLANKTTLGGQGGAITVIAYDPSDPNTPAPAGATPSGVAGTLRSYGSTKGGALTLEVPNVLITDAAVAPAAGQVVLPSALFSAGFSSYTIKGDGGVAVADGTVIQSVEPVYQFADRSLMAPTGSDPAVAFSLTSPPLYVANPNTATLVQRQGSSITLQSAFAQETSGAGGGAITLGNNALIGVDPGQSVRVEAFGQITIDGSIMAPSGSISVVNDRYQGIGFGKFATYLPNLSIWLGTASRLDVSAQPFTALDRFGRPFGTVPAGGTIQIGGAGGTDSRGYTVTTDAYVIARPGSVLAASGTSAMFDPGAGAAAPLPFAVAASDRAILVASKGGSIAFDSESGLVLDGTLLASPGGSGAQGGALTVSLVSPIYNADPRVPSITVPNELRVPRELTIGAASAVSPVPTSLRSGDPLPNTAIGQARLSAAQIGAGGFDAVSLASGDAILFDGNVTLRGGRSITLTTSVLGETSPSGGATIAAPYVALNGLPSTFNTLLSVTGAGTIAQQFQVSSVWNPSARASQAMLSVTASDIDIANNLYAGVNSQIALGTAGSPPVGCSATACIIDRLGFGQINLASSGDIRFLPSTGGFNFTTLTTPGNLSLTAAQIYPVAGAQAVVTAGFDPNAFAGSSTLSNAYRTDGVLTIARAPGPTPAPPLTVGGTLTLSAGDIEQGGVVRAPGGQITLGTFNTNGNFGPQWKAPTAFPYAVNFLPSSMTSVSAAGLTIPYGGTTDGVTYTLNGAAVTASATLNTAKPPALTVQAQVVTLAGGATLDLSGGGVFAGAGFITGRGGSVDVLQTPMVTLNAAGKVTVPSSDLVFAILPGFTDSVAPPPATAGSFTGPLPQPGNTIALPAGIPGLAAGSYTLLPASDALLPGAFRVEIAPGNHTLLAGAVTLGNGSYQVDGFQGVANTGFRDALPVAVTVSSGANVRLYAQYNEQTYSQFNLAQAARFDQPRPLLLLPEDAKTLAIAFPSVPAAGPALIVAGDVNMRPAAGGIGGTARITAQAALEITPAGAAPTSGFVSVPDSALNNLAAETLAIGGYPIPSLVSASIVFQAPTPAVALRSGAVLSAPQVFLAAGVGGVTVEQGASISTLGKGAPSFDSSSGLLFDNNGLAVLAVTNGVLSFSPATSGGPVSIGTCAASCTGTTSLYAEGTIALVTGGSVALDSRTRYGAAAIDLYVPTVNIGTPGVGVAVPPGLTLSQDLLGTLLNGDPVIGAPPLRQLTLTANQSVNFYGSVDLNTINPVTGRSSLTQLELNTPAIYGVGGPADTVTLTTGTLIWNGIANAATSRSQAPGPVIAGGTSGGTLNIVADQIVLGYGPNEQTTLANQTSPITLDRLILGFGQVTLTGNQQITSNNQGTVSVYQTSPGTADGNLTLATPLLTGAPGSIAKITAGGNLTIVPTVGGPNVGRTNALGAEIDLTAASVSNNTAIVLPSGRLVMKAAGDITLADGSRIDLAGQTTSFFDQTRDSWGGDVVLHSATGNITQQAGASIDISASSADAGTLSITATGLGAGRVAMNGTIRGSAPVGFTAGSFDLRAQGFDATANLTAGFSALNALLDQGGVYGARSFDLKTGSLSVAAGTIVKAAGITVSVDGGALDVAGKFDASGPTPGTIRLAASSGLTVGSGAVLDARGTRLQVDSYGQPIAAENRGNVELTVSGTGGILTLAPGATIDLSTPDGVAYGSVVLNAPRIGGNDIGISALGSLTIAGANSISLNAFRTYSPTDSTGTVTQHSGSVAGSVNLDRIDADSTAFIAAASVNTGLIGRLAGLASSTDFHLRPGAEIDSNSASGGNLTVNGDLDLSGYRYGPNAKGGGSGEPGTLVLRAADNLLVTGNITDGFSPPARAGVWEIAPMLPLLPDATQPKSWSLRLVAGADLGAADSRVLLAPSQLVASSLDPTPGTITLNNPRNQPTASVSGQPTWSVVRTGIGDLELLAGGDIRELSPYGLYTTGAQTAVAPAYDVPRGQVTFPGTVSFTGRNGTVIPAGTLVTDGRMQFAVQKSATIRGGVAPPLQVLPVATGVVYSDPPGTLLSLVTPITGVSAKVATTLSSGSVLGPNGTSLESLVTGSNYHAYYPSNGGNVLISAQGNVTGDILTPTATGIAPPDAIGNWLWRQGGSGSSPNTAWWLNFGTYVLPLGATEALLNGSSSVPMLTGFVGIGTLGGGNVTILAGGNAGEIAVGPSGTIYSSSQGLDVAIASTGRVGPTGAITETGGGVLTIRVGRALNGGGTDPVNNQANGTLTDLRGSISVRAGSIGQVLLQYGQSNALDPRFVSPLVPTQAISQGGPTLVVGDATASVSARGDLVLGGAGDATRLPEQNLTPVASGAIAAAAGYSWFSLWQPDAAINLFSAGGNLTISTQSQSLTNGSYVDYANSIATDSRFVYPPTLTAIAANGSIYAGAERSSVASTTASSVELAPSPNGQLELLARGSIYANQYATVNGGLGYPQSIDISGAAPTGLPNPLQPAFITIAGVTQVSSINPNVYSTNANNGLPSLFAFEADTASGLLHAGDRQPALIYAGGDIVDLGLGETLSFQAGSNITPAIWYIAGKAARIVAGGDIVEPGVRSLPGTSAPSQSSSYSATGDLILSNNPTDVSVVQAGRDIIFANFDVAGPGQFYLQAGRNLYQADQGVLESIGPVNPDAQTRNGGSSITALVGAGPDGPNWAAFAQLYLDPANQGSVGTSTVAVTYASQLLRYLQQNFGYQGTAANALSFFQCLPVDQQRSFLLQTYFAELRASGREFTDPSSVRFKSYARGREAIATLFPASRSYQGDITLFGGSGIRTDFGGSITLLTPGGQTVLGVASGPAPPASAGVLTQGQGNVDIFSQGSVLLGQSRVFTTFGGDIVIWSGNGDINAGRGAKTTDVFTPSRILYDAFGNITYSPSVPTTGAGIATLAPIPGTAPGTVDLIAPLGTIDAGEAGIRASGNVNLAALTVVNAANIQVQGKSTGLPTIAAPNVTALSAASATAAAAAQSAQQMSQNTSASASRQAPSDITVEVTGLGEGTD
jgi:filamentous hemagglutinin family protein